MALPYPNALRLGVHDTGEDIRPDLTTILRDFKPTKIFLSHPADHNPDQRALCLFTRVGALIITQRNHCRRTVVGRAAGCMPPFFLPINPVNLVNLSKISNCASAIAPPAIFSFPRGSVSLCSPFDLSAFPVE